MMTAIPILMVAVPPAILFWSSNRAGTAGVGLGRIASAITAFWGLFLIDACFAVHRRVANVLASGDSDGAINDSGPVIVVVMGWLPAVVYVGILLLARIVFLKLEKVSVSSRTGLRLLRVFLVLAGLTWAVSRYGVFADWTDVSSFLEGLGAQKIPDDPMLNYWLRMASTAYSLVGFWFWLMAARPRQFHAAIPWFGRFMVIEGVFLLAHGLNLQLAPFPLLSDAGACLVLGAGILATCRHANPAVESSATPGAV